MIFKRKQKKGTFQQRQTNTDLPDLADLYTLAYNVIDQLPEKFTPYTKTLLVRIENFADEETLFHLGLKDKYELLGLYKGIPLPFKGSQESFTLPDVIFLFRCPLIRYARETNETIQKLVHHVMIHEIGHHFGFSDFEMDLLETNS